MGMSKFGLWREFNNPPQSPAVGGNPVSGSTPGAEEEHMNKTAETVLNFIKQRMTGKSITGNYDDVANFIIKVAQEVMSHAPVTKSQGKLPAKSAMTVARALSKPAQSAGM